MHEMLPLRTTRMLGDFASDEVLPHRLGDLRSTRFPLLKLTDTDWFAADHAMEVTGVQVNDEPILSWVAETRTDDAGHTWTVVVLGAAAPPDARMTGTGIGKLDGRTGRLLTNPADLMEYVMGLAGRPETFPQLRAEAAAEGIELAGSLDEVMSIRLWLDRIAYSAGAIWTIAAARLYPVFTVEGSVTDLERLSAVRIVPTSDVADTTDILRVSYNEDESNSRFLAYVELSAHPPQYGGVATEVELPWLRTSSNAESVGRRMMYRMAGRTVSVTMAAQRADGVKVRPCEWVRLVDNPGWPFEGADPVLMALAVSVHPDAMLNECTLEHTRDSPAVVVTAHSVAVPVGLGAGIDLSIANGIATIGVTDEVGKPLVDAWVSLDNGPARKTDAQGKVQFEVIPSEPPNKHLLAVEAPGMMPFLLDIFF